MGQKFWMISWISFQSYNSVTCPSKYSETQTEVSYNLPQPERSKFKECSETEPLLSSMYPLSWCAICCTQILQILCLNLPLCTQPKSLHPCALRNLLSIYTDEKKNKDCFTIHKQLSYCHILLNFLRQNTPQNSDLFLEKRSQLNHTE